MKLQRLLKNLGWDGVLIGVSGLAAFLLGLLDFTSLISITNEPALRILLSGMGLLLGAVVVQTSRRSNEIREIRDAIGTSEINLLDNDQEFGNQLTQEVLSAHKFISNTLLTYAVPRLSTNHGFSGPQEEFHKILYKRVTKGELSFRHVVTIYHKQMLEDVIFKLLLHDGYRFYIRHYEPPPAAMPMLNILSRDDEAFIFGSYEIGVTPSESQRISIRDPKIKQFLKGYWNVLWEKSLPINDGGIINWGELKRVGLRFNIDENGFDKMVSEIKIKVNQIKRKL